MPNYSIMRAAASILLLASYLLPWVKISECAASGNCAAAQWVWIAGRTDLLCAAFLAFALALPAFAVWEAAKGKEEPYAAKSAALFGFFASASVLSVLAAGYLKTKPADALYYVYAHIGSGAAVAFAASLLIALSLLQERSAKKSQEKSAAIPEC